MNKVTVIDMTGPEKRILSGYHAIGVKTTDEDIRNGPAKECMNFNMPELTHNLDLILEICEQEIISIDKNQKIASDRKLALQQERENLEKIVKLENNHIKTLESALDLVSLLTSPEESITLDQAMDIFNKIQTEFAAEYEEFGLVDLMPGVIAPLLSKELSNWNPLYDPSFAVQRIQNIKNSIVDEKGTKGDNIFDPYSSLIWFGVVPNIRKAINNWDPRNHHDLLNLLGKALLLNLIC